VVKHTPMVPAVRSGVSAPRPQTAGAGVGWNSLTEVALALGRDEFGVRRARMRGLSHRTVRYRVRAALRLWRVMW
jgi:hypothetical protein